MRDRVIVLNNPVNWVDPDGLAPKPTPNFQPPTNPPQPPPQNVPPDWRVRIMPPTEQYPDGYWSLEKPMKDGSWQPIDPSTMKPGSRCETHVPLPRRPPIPWWGIPLELLLRPLLIINPEFYNNHNKVA